MNTSVLETNQVSVISLVVGSCETVARVRYLLMEMWGFAFAPLLTAPAEGRWWLLYSGRESEITVGSA